NPSIEAECVGSLIKGGVGGRLIDARSHAVLVVDADKNHRQAPHAGHVHALIENALLHCAVAKECERDGIFLQVFARQASTDNRWDTAAHDSVGPQMTECHVGNVHGAALAMAIAGFPAADFGHHLPGIGAAGEKDAMAAMMRRKRVLWLHGRTYTGGSSFFANGKMKHRTCRLATHEEFANAFFKGADAAHRSIEFEKIGVTRILHVRLRQTCLLQMFHDVRFNALTGALVWWYARQPRPLRG